VIARADSRRPLGKGACLLRLTVSARRLHSRIVFTNIEQLFSIAIDPRRREKRGERRGEIVPLPG
jgi:hypothetical protein